MTQLQFAAIIARIAKLEAQVDQLQAQLDQLHLASLTVRVEPSTPAKSKPTKRK